MKILKNVCAMQKEALRLKRAARSIGFVPTMGYLHEGHAALLRSARRENDVVVLSVFVNPTQFGPKEDFKKYPRDFKRDAAIARGAGADIIFFPSVRDMYPPDDYFTPHPESHIRKGMDEWLSGGIPLHGKRNTEKKDALPASGGRAVRPWSFTYVDVNEVTETLCGRSRPGHFRGVATVVAKLLNIVQCDRLYLGQKDFQQTVVLRRMIADLNMPVKVRVMPTVRESDGLAMSSRNLYLSPSERQDALVLIKSLKSAGAMIAKGERRAKRVIAMIKKMITKVPSAKIDYIAITDTVTLNGIKTIDRDALIALAVFVGRTRLIDNMIVRMG